MAVFGSEIPRSWWALDAETILSKLETSPAGLPVEEAHRRFKTYGANELAKQERRSVARRLIAKLTNPLILILLIAGLLSGLLGQVTDFFVIAAMTVLSVALDTYQEHSAQVAAEKLQKSVSLTATVVHMDIKKEEPFTRLVPGHIVFLSSGDIVPADGRLIEAEDLMIDQSTLTGESYPKHKNAQLEVSAGAALTERDNSVFMGTHVVSGQGTMVVVTTAGDTELGKIAQSLVGEREQTEFEKGITGYGTMLMRLVFILAPVVFFAHFTQGRDTLGSLLFVLALAVGFAPELLPLVVTINLSKGAMRMSGKGVIVKRLPAIENFGSMDVLCTDKTGTLTENTIKLVLFEDIHGKKSDDVLKLGYLVSKFQTSVESPIERAVLEKGRDVPVAKFHKVFEVPFDFYRKRMSVVVGTGLKTLLVTKGSPESTIANCTHVVDGGKKVVLTPALRSTILRRFGTLSDQGLRVLAVGEREVRNVKKYTTADETNLTLVGFLSFLDPPKRSARAALALLEHKGITVKVLTGDNEGITKKVCEELGLPVAGVITDTDVERLDDDALSRAVEGATIFARLTPESKKRVIAALRKNGHVVGYLGDGVNDAPSLRAGDIGISVANAVDVAKESADMILLHKDLHVLQDGVMEGRHTFANVMKYIKMGTSSNFGNMVSVAVASLFLPFLPMLPVQILFNDFLYDVSQLFVANDAVDAEVVARPHKWDIAAIRHFMLVFGLISSLFDGLTFIVLLLFLRATPALFQTGWFLESLVTQTLIIFSIRTARVPFFKSHPGLSFAFGLYGVVAFALLLPILPIGKLFSFVVPPPPFFVLLFFIIATYMVIVETAKHWFYARYEV